MPPAEHRLRVRRLVGEAGPVHDAEVVLDGDRIAEIRPDSPGEDQLDGWLIPGFVDTHCHGAAGADFTDADAAGVRRIVDYHRGHGTTTMIGSLVSAPVEQLAGRLRDLPADVPGLAGYHLEGPFLSAAKCGAHDPAVLRDPDAEAVETLLASSDALKMITLAPERTGGLAAVARCAEVGVVAAIGHTDGDADLARAAIERGATVGTHLFNAMRAIHHREPGPVPVLLTDPRIVVELICDGHHLADDAIRLAIAAAGPDRVALITDAMSATGLPDGLHPIGGLTAQVDAGLARIRNQDGTLGSIAGSTLTMATAFERVVGLGYAIEDVARMAATTPARVHGLGDVGVLAPGRLADAVLVDDAGRLAGVLWRGAWWSPPQSHGIGSRQSSGFAPPPA